LQRKVRGRLLQAKLAGVTAKAVKVRGDAGTVQIHFGPDARGPFPLALRIRATILDAAVRCFAEPRRLLGCAAALSASTQAIPWESTQLRKTKRRW